MHAAVPAAICHLFDKASGKLLWAGNIRKKWHGTPTQVGEARPGNRKRLMIQHLKRGKPDADRAGDDSKVRETVEVILKDIESRGDAAVRELEKFDKYSPPSFRLSQSEIEGLMAKVSAREMEDIKLLRRRSELRPGATGPCATSRLRPSRVSFPVTRTFRFNPLAATCRPASLDGGLGAHVSGDRLRRGRPRSLPRRRPSGAPNPAVITAMHLGGAHEIYVLGGIQAIGAMALGTETIAPVDMLVGPGNAFVAEAKRQLYGRVGLTSSPGRPRRWLLLTTQSMPRCARPTCWDRRNTATTLPPFW